MNILSNSILGLKNEIKEKYEVQNCIQFVLLLYTNDLWFGSPNATNVWVDNMINSFMSTTNFWFLSYLEKRKLVKIRIFEKCFVKILEIEKKQKYYYSWIRKELKKFDTSMMKDRTIKLMQERFGEIFKPVDIHRGWKYNMIRQTFKYQSPVYIVKFNTYDVSYPDEYYEHTKYIQNGIDVSDKIDKNIVPQSKFIETINIEKSIPTRRFEYVGKNVYYGFHDMKLNLENKSEKRWGLKEMFEEYLNENMNKNVIRTKDINMVENLINEGMIIEK